MAVDVRDLIKKDKQFPSDLTGKAGYVPVVNPGETAHTHQAFVAQNHPAIIGGNATVSGNVFTFEPCECWDSTRLVYLQTTENKSVTLPSTVNATQIKYYFYLVKLVADGSCEFRAYLAKTGASSPATDAEVSNYRYRCFGRTFTDGVAVNCVVIGDTILFVQASKCISAVNLTTSYATIDHSDLLDVDELLGVQYGLYSPSTTIVAYICYSSLDGTNLECRIGRNGGHTIDEHGGAWGWSDDGVLPMLPYTSARKFSANIGTSPYAKLLYKSVRLKLSF